MRDFTLAKILTLRLKAEASRSHPMTHLSPSWRDKDTLPAMSPSEGKLGLHGLRTLHCSGEKGT